MRAVITGLLAPYEDKCHAIAFDNGKEFAEHEIKAAALKADIYFARPNFLGARIKREQQRIIEAVLPQENGTDLHHG